MTMLTRSANAPVAARSGAQRLLRGITRPHRLSRRTAVHASAAGSAQAEKDAQLVSTWQRYSKLLTASGDIKLSEDDPLRVFYTYSTNEGASALVGGVVSFPLTRNSTSADAATAADPLQQLVAAAAPSPFGKGSKTVYDSSVRTAVEIKAGQLAVNKTMPPFEVLEEIRLLLAPNASSVIADLDKLNIYGPGGFFKPHYDTPRSEDHFGTLIISLPTMFQGGQLVLRHIDHNNSAKPPTKTYDWSTADGVAPPESLRWAAFYSDTEHEVLPVTEGYRVTLTYNLRAVEKQPAQLMADISAALETPPEGSKYYSPSNAEQTLVTSEGVQIKPSRSWPAIPWDSNARDSGSKESTAASGNSIVVPDSSKSSGRTGAWMTAADVSSSAELAAQFKALLSDDETWHPKGERLGFILQHKYCKSLRGLSSLSFPEALKGPDRLLAAALQQAGLDIKVRPVFRAYTGFEDEDTYQDCEYEDEDEGEHEDEDEGKDEAVVNFGRPLQPAQQKDPLTSQKGAYWALVLGSFDACAEAIDAGYQEDALPWTSENTTDGLMEVFGAHEHDVCWVTPVRDEHFTYYGSVLAGANCAYEVSYLTTAAIVVDVPSCKERKRLLAQAGAT